MSKLTAAAATAHTLSVTAMEEASRTGERTAGIDHLLLALVVNEQLAGQVLRSFGITLSAARDAVAAQHAAQLASLGIRSDAPAPDRITFHETNDSEWGESALEIIKRSAEGERAGDAGAVLRELLAETSGLIEAVLHRLGTAPEEVRARLDEVERHSARVQHSFDPGALSGTSESFAPADPVLVWELLADPARMPEWEPGTGGVEDVSSQIVIGSSWTARAPLERPDGKPLRVRPAYRTARVELVDRQERHRIAWRFTWPDAPRANTRRVSIELEPAAGGTQLVQLGGSISRVFR
ncbi:MAG: SRPBCC family protein [Leucobacter sp.]